MEPIKKCANLISKAKKITVLTGAGISVESGIPDFRSPGGLWERFDPFEYAHIDSFRKNPYKVWEMLLEMGKIINKAKPNFAHISLKELENMGKTVTVITQNIDALHSKAGSSVVLEYHGTWRKMVCINCGEEENSENFNEDIIPICPTCKIPYKPAVIFFGEPIDTNINLQSTLAAKNCDLFIVIGTSAQVYPAAALPDIAYRNNIPVVEINLEPTHLTNSVTSLFLQGKATSIMKQLMKEIE